MEISTRTRKGKTVTSIANFDTGVKTLYENPDPWVTKLFNRLNLMNLSKEDRQGLSEEQIRGMLTLDVCLIPKSMIAILSELLLEADSSAKDVPITFANDGQLKIAGDFKDHLTDIFTKYIGADSVFIEKVEKEEEEQKDVLEPVAVPEFEEIKEGFLSDDDDVITPGVYRKALLDLADILDTSDDAVKRDVLKLLPDNGELPPWETTKIKARVRISVNPRGKKWVTQVDGLHVLRTESEIATMVGEWGDQLGTRIWLDENFTIHLMGDRSDFVEKCLIGMGVKVDLVLPILQKKAERRGKKSERPEVRKQGGKQKLHFNLTDF